MSPIFSVSETEGWSRDCRFGFALVVGVAKILRGRKHEIEIPGFSQA
jgi:hypothetical protein